MGDFFADDPPPEALPPELAVVWRLSSTLKRSDGRAGWQEMEAMFKALRLSEEAQEAWRAAIWVMEEEAIRGFNRELPDEGDKGS